MGAWGTTLDPTGKSGIRFLADPHSELTSALDLSFDGAAIFGNARSKRYALVVENGKVTKAFVEPDNTGLDGMSFNFITPSCRIQYHSRNHATELLLTVRPSNSQRCRKGAWQCLDLVKQSVFARQPTRLVHTEQTRVRQSIETDLRFNPNTFLADRAARHDSLDLCEIQCGVSCTIFRANLISITGSKPTDSSHSKAAEAKSK
jgi:hypothetical protein